MATVAWREDLDQALGLAQTKDMPVFVDFFNPG